MELTEVLSRIFRRHWRLIGAFVLLGLSVAFAMHWNDKPAYRGSARLLVASSDPSTSSEAGALADTVRALATGPALVRKALDSIGVDRDPNEVASSAVGVRSLGSSGVVEIEVTDRNPVVALRLTRAIAEGVVDQRTDSASDSLNAAIREIGTEINALQAQIADVDRQLTRVNADAGSIDPSVANRAIAERDQLLARRAGLTDQVTVLTSSKQDLTAQLAAHPPAAMVDPPEAPATLVTPQRFPDLALGGLLGLVLGVAAAAAVETVRPTVIGRAAIARSLQAPVLGEVRRSGADWNLGNILEAASHIGLAAAGASVKRVDFMTTSRQIDLPPLALAVGDELTHLSVEVATPDSIVGRVISGVDASHAGRSSHRGRPAPQRGVVVVVPEAVKLADLEPVRDFLLISGWPLLGVIIAQRENPLVIVRRESTTQPALTSEASA